MDPEGEFMRRHKVFTRTTLIAEVASRLYGHDPVELDAVLEHVLGYELAVPLIPALFARRPTSALGSERTPR